jgi:hypothetical protein
VHFVGNFSIVFNFGYVAIEIVDFAREVNSVWYLIQQVSFFAGGKTGYTTRQQEGIFCEMTDRQLKGEKIRSQHKISHGCKSVQKGRNLSHIFHVKFKGVLEFFRTVKIRGFDTFRD